MAVGWSCIRTQVTFRTYIVARKILDLCDPMELLCRFADEEDDGSWKVRRPRARLIFASYVRGNLYL